MPRSAAIAIVVVSCGAACVSVPTSPVEQQRDYARVLEPESVAPPPVSRGVADLGTLRIRAYVDDAYNASSREPDARLRQSIDDASAILQAQLGATLTLVDVKPFAPHAGELPAILEELRRTDKADDVDLVIGFLAAAPIVTSSLHQLGYADVLGRYAVVRALDDVREVQAIESILNRLPDGERAGLIERRRRHKAAIVLLHEVAHDLGGVHVEDPEAVLFPAYSLEQNRLNEDALALLTKGIAWHRGKNDVERAQAAADVAAELKSRRDRFERAGVDEAIAMMEQRAEAPRPGAHTLLFSAGDAKAYNGAIAAMRNGDGAGAWKSLAPVAGKDAQPAILVLACHIAAMDGAVILDGRARCERAMSAAPDDVEPAAAALRFTQRAHDDALEKTAFDAAASRIARATQRTANANANASATTSATSAAIDGAAFLVDIADLARMRGRLTLAEDAVALAVDDTRAAIERTHIVAARRRHGIPRGAVAPDVEPALVTELDALFDVVDKDPKAALLRIDGDVARFGDIAGLFAARCEALGKTGHLADAEKACAASIAKDPDASIGHALSGVVAGARGHTDVAVAELERAIALDPESPPAWQALRSILAKARKKDALAALEERYRAQFPPAPSAADGAPSAVAGPGAATTSQ